MNRNLGIILLGLALVVTGIIIYSVITQSNSTTVSIKLIEKEAIATVQPNDTIVFRSTTPGPYWVFFPQGSLCTGPNPILGNDPTQPAKCKVAPPSANGRSSYVFEWGTGTYPPPPQTFPSNAIPCKGCRP